MKIHLVTNLDTEETFVQGASRRYTLREYEHARQAAKRGNRDAIAMLDDIRAGAELGHEDCPECQAALARGETPIVVKPKRWPRWPRRPRWRTMR